MHASWEGAPLNCLVFECVSVFWLNILDVLIVPRISWCLHVSCACVLFKGVSAFGGVHAGNPILHHKREDFVSVLEKRWHCIANVISFLGLCMCCVFPMGVSGIWMSLLVKRALK